MKKNIVITILAILVLGLGGYLVYDKILSSDNNEVIENDEVKEENVKNNETNTEENKADKDVFSMTEIYLGGMAIAYNGSVYVKFDNSYPGINAYSFYGEGTYQILANTIDNKYGSYTIGDFEYINVYNMSEFKGLKLNTDNVKAVYTFNRGQAIPMNASLILLHNDNTLSIISIYSLINGKIDVTKINELNNIVNIVHGGSGGIGGGAETYAVTSSGEKINLAQYIPEDYLSF